MNSDRVWNANTELAKIEEERRRITLRLREEDLSKLSEMFQGYEQKDIEDFFKKLGYDIIFDAEVPEDYIRIYDPKKLMIFNEKPIEIFQDQLYTYLQRIENMKRLGML